MKIAIAGIGYVGLSNGVLLSQQNEVTMMDIDHSKVSLINQKKSPIAEAKIEEYLKTKNLNISAVTDYKTAFDKKDFIIIAVPTNLDSKTGKFDTSILDNTVSSAMKINPSATVIIKSTVPIGYTENISKKYPSKNIIFSPEFLREGLALEDNLSPSRIVIGSDSENARTFTKLLTNSAIKKDIEIIYTNNTEAEAIKLFSNSYLAMRVAFFNELDSFALKHELSTKNIINGVSADPRIGSFYNNPSFGYGGYCLAKDTKQLLSSYDSVPQNLINGIIKSNDTRINYIAAKVLSLQPKKIGIYRLTMKSGSDNWRESSSIRLIQEFIKRKIKVIVFEPLMESSDTNLPVTFVHSVETLNERVDLILANRLDDIIEKYKDKVFTRDVYGNN